MPAHVRQNKDPQEKVLILGLGNIFCKDDGIGSLLARKLASTFHDEENIDVLDGGTTGLGLLYLFEDYSRIIVIDAVDIQNEPGEVFLFNPDDLEQTYPVGPVSSHQPGILELLRAGKLLGKMPEEVLIIGVQIKELNSEYGLSPELERKVPFLEKKIKEAIIFYLRNA